MIQEEFNKLVDEFISNSIVKDEGWILKEQNMCKFLTLRFYKKIQTNSSELNTDFEKIEDEDDSISDVKSSILMYDLHVVFSISYQVPVLYFNIYKDDIILKYDEILALSDVIPDNKYTFITQGAHPILGKMFYNLHPCQTLEFMKLVMENEKGASYLKSWLSIYGSMIGYYLNKDLFKGK